MRIVVVGIVAVLGVFPPARAHAQAPTGAFIDTSAAAEVTERSGLVIPNTEVREVASSSGLRYFAYVHLPPEYYQSDARFPVVFLTDAESEVSGMYAGIQTMIRFSDQVRDVILVGIADAGTRAEHRVRRVRDYTPTSSPTRADVDGRAGSGGSDEFLRFLRDEFVPFIERDYRTDPSRRGLWGLSFGALFGTYVLFHEPALFSRYILASPSMWWDVSPAREGVWVAWLRDGAVHVGPVRARVGTASPDVEASIGHTRVAPLQADAGEPAYLLVEGSTGPLDVVLTTQRDGGGMLWHRRLGGDAPSSSSPGTSGGS
jgi:hypothetical protein